MAYLDRLPAKPALKEKTPELVLIEATVALMNELVKVMALEIDLLTARKLDEHKELLKQKQRLTMDYRSNMKSIAVQPALLKQLPENVREAVRISAQKLADMTDRNAKFLRGAVMATQRLIQNIVSIVKQEVLPTSGYRNLNTAHLQLGTYSPTCKPVTGSRTA